jgi:glycosyltransferase involved in cell wall biosynthesis
MRAVFITRLIHQMRVAIEAAPLGLSSCGLARYTAELSTALARVFPEDEFVLVSDQPFVMPNPSPANLTRGGGPRNAVERRWWLWGLGCEAARLGADVVHGPDFAVPYIPRLPSVLTLHDLSPWMEPFQSYTSERIRRRTPVLMEMGAATMVVTDSEAVRRQALDRFRLRPDRIVAVPLAAAAHFRPVGAPPHPPYFLYVGSIEPRKNLLTLVDAWRTLRRRCAVDLVLAGKVRVDGSRLQEEPGLRILGEAPEQRLPELYSGAVAFVFPSSYEGFGLPVLEAMQCGACVIATRAVMEAGGDAAVYADTAEEMARAMRTALEMPGWLSERRERSLVRAAEFSWERTARLTYCVYQEALHRFAN